MKSTRFWNQITLSLELYIIKYLEPPTIKNHLERRERQCRGKSEDLDRKKEIKE